MLQGRDIRETETLEEFDQHDRKLDLIQAVSDTDNDLCRVLEEVLIIRREIAATRLLEIMR